jgi:hypothetical protein
MRQVSLVQSFVLDLKVNDLLRRKGFDMSPIEEDQAHTLANLGQMLAHGRRFEMAREEAFYAMQVADAMVRRELAHATSDLVRLDSSLELIRHSGSPLAALAESFAASVTKHGYDSRDGVLSAVDECLLASFDFCGDPIDLDSELICVNPPEPDIDKFPLWLQPLPPKVKCQVGRHMARSDISSEWGLVLNPTVTGRARVNFQSPDGDRCELRLFHPLGPPTRYSDLPDIIAENLAMRHRNETGSYQLNGGPPHRNPLNPPDAPMHPVQPHPGLFAASTGASGSLAAGVHEASARAQYGSPLELPGPAPDNDGQTAWSPNQGVPGRGLPPGFGPSVGRPYMAGLGRWTTQARLQEQLGGEHPYAYANCNPVTYVDPDGDKPIKAGSASSLPAGCWICAGEMFALDYWQPAHKKDHGYAHCMACCILTSLYGPACAAAAQTAQNIIDPKKGATGTRLSDCLVGVEIGLGAPSDGYADCNSKCQKAFPLPPGVPPFTPPPGSCRPGASYQPTQHPKPGPTGDPTPGAPGAFGGYGQACYN